MTTITFRMNLRSPSEIAVFAKNCGFKGIELWEPHWCTSAPSDWRWEKDASLKLVALSGYLDLTDASMQSTEWRGALVRKLDICAHLNIPALRLFTGRISGTQATEADWDRFFIRLRDVEMLAKTYKTAVVFETHPGTLLDTKDNVDRFIKGIENAKFSCIGLNFDAFHVWEFGFDPVACLGQWYPHVKHVHVKNAVGRTRDFDPANVFSPYGAFEDLTSLAQGVVGIAAIVDFLRDHNYSGAITVEWLGKPQMDFLMREVQYLKVCAHELAAAATG